MCTDERLLVAREGRLTVNYAPFDWVNHDARVVLVGITPGKTQANNALAEARKALAESASHADALARAKRSAAFSGAMRGNLIRLLDRIEIGNAFGLDSSAELFASASNLLQTTSVLPLPVFVDGQDYNGNPDLIRTSFLNRMMEQYFLPVVNVLQKAVFIPMGPIPTKVMLSLANRGLVNREQILDGIPHPSGANAERINYFLGEKARDLLSKKTDPDKLDDARRALLHRVAALRG